MILRRDRGVDEKNRTYLFNPWDGKLNTYPNKRNTLYISSYSVQSVKSLRLKELSKKLMSQRRRKMDVVGDRSEAIAMQTAIITNIYFPCILW